MANRKSAIGAMVQQAVIPAMQQMAQQQSQQIVQQIAQIIQSQPQDAGIDPMMLQELMAAIQGIVIPPIDGFVQTLENISMQIDALAMSEVRPTEWKFEVKRDPQTEFIKSVEVTPL